MIPLNIRKTYYEIEYAPSLKETKWTLKNNISMEIATITMAGIIFTINETGTILYAEIKDWAIKDTVFYEKTTSKDNIKYVKNMHLKFRINKTGYTFERKIKKSYK